MTIIVLQNTEQIATKGNLTPKEIQIVKIMLETGSSIQEVETYLLKQDQIVIGKDENKELSVYIFNNDNLDEKVLIDIFEHLKSEFPI